MGKLDELKKQKEEAAKSNVAKLEAASKIRKAAMRVMQSTEQNYDEVRKELEEIMATELDNAGENKDKIFEETEKIAEAARKRIDGIREKKRAEQEAKNEVK